MQRTCQQHDNLQMCRPYDATLVCSTTSVGAAQALKAGTDMDCPSYAALQVCTCLALHAVTSFKAFPFHKRMTEARSATHIVGQDRAHAACACDWPGRQRTTAGWKVQRLLSLPP